MLPNLPVRTRMGLMIPELSTLPKNLPRNISHLKPEPCHKATQICTQVTCNNLHQ